MDKDLNDKLDDLIRHAKISGLIKGLELIANIRRFDDKEKGTDYFAGWDSCLDNLIIDFKQEIKFLEAQDGANVQEKKCSHLFTTAVYEAEKLQGYKCNSCGTLLPVNPRYQKRKTKA